MWKKKIMVFQKLKMKMNLLVLPNQKKTLILSFYLKKQKMMKMIKISMKIILITVKMLKKKKIILLMIIILLKKIIK